MEAREGVVENTKTRYNMMKKVMVLVLLAVGMTGLVMGAEPVARITSDTITLAAGATNGVKDTWLNTGDDTAVISAGGTVKTGAGIIRALTYKAVGSVTNGTITFCAYDGGVTSVLWAVTGVTSNLPSARFDLVPTNLIYTGRLRVSVAQDAYTNAACSWSWGAIVE